MLTIKVFTDSYHQKKGARCSVDNTLRTVKVCDDGGHNCRQSNRVILCITTKFNHHDYRTISERS